MTRSKSPTSYSPQALPPAIRAALLVATALLLPALLLGGYVAMAVPSAHGPRDITPGVSLEIADLKADANGAGRLYLARATLDPAQLDLFITPSPPALAGTKYTHRLAHTARVARDNRLVVATNGSLFSSESGRVRRPGELATIVETTVSSGATIHWWQYAYMLGFTPDLTPDPVTTLSPDRDRLSRWKWAFGSQTVRKTFDWDPRYEVVPDRYSVVAVNPDTRQFALAVFTHANLQRMRDELTPRGFSYLYVQDGSESATLAVNGKALTGDWRPVASHNGIRLLTP